MRVLLLIIGLFLMSDCSTSPRLKSGYSAEELLNYACTVGKTIRSAEGHLWLKTNSKEVSGQFPADVTVSSSRKLNLEITNILGGTEALIVVDGDHYQIKRGNHNKDVREEGYGTWGGIPLRWASDLFLGKIPCPETARHWKLNTDAKGDLIVETGGAEAIQPERYTYRFRQLGESPWPDSLLWERLGNSAFNVEFTFDDPEDKTMSPRKWEAKSSRGNVKVRWSNREVEQSPK